MVESTTQQLNLVFYALSDPTRRALLDALKTRQLTVSQLAEPFKMSLAAISKHLKVLERANLIHREKRGSSYCMSFNREGLLTAEQWLNTYQDFWGERLDQLKQQLESTEENP